MSVLNEKQFQNETAAYKWVEVRIWPNGPVCPHCSSKDKIYEIKGKTTRIGLKKCGACRKPFTVKVGTIFEDSHVKMHIWLQAIFLMSSSKKGISSQQLHRTLGVTLKTAWFMSHRIREAMKDHGSGPVGGENKIVEMDETYVGGKEGNKHANKRLRVGALSGKDPIVALVERDGGVRSFHVPEVTAKNVGAILHSQVSKETRIMTDDSTVYNRKVMGDFASHETVNHSAAEYVRGDVHTNTIEGYFSVLKRGIVGTFHHVSQQHLNRYLSEFDFRYNARASLGVDDVARTEKAVLGIIGKRLTYRTTNSGRP